jgi:hypothetical protein
MWISGRGKGRSTAVVGGWLTPSYIDQQLDLGQSTFDELERLGDVWNNARQSGSSLIWAATQVLAVGVYDLIGVTGLYNAISGEELITLERLGTWERIQQGLDGGIRLVSTVMGGTRAVSGARAWRPDGAHGIHSRPVSSPARKWSSARWSKSPRLPPHRPAAHRGVVWA